MEVSHKFYPAVKDAELKEGTVRGVVLGGVEVLLARVGGDIYAVSNRCGHQGTNLSDGALQDHVVECPLHGARFDLRSGAVVRTPQIRPELTANYGPLVGKTLTQIGTKAIPHFKVRITKGVIEVEIPGTAEATESDERV
ncbi:MAG: Rieske 2Fe-2S domain-containing protein [Parcubacteria group bacterium]